MSIKRDWDIAFDQEQFLKLSGDAYTRMLQRPSMQRAWEAAFAEAPLLVKPAAVWNTVAISEQRHEKFVLENGARIGNGPVTTVMGGASHLVAAVCTIGHELSDRAKEHQRAGESLEALVLDQLGTFAVGMLSQRLCHFLEAEAADRGLRTSTYLSPGESVWSIKDQAVIFSLVDATAIGVSLTESMLMNPIKSLSLVMGLGDKPMGEVGATHCDYCTMADRCTYRASGQAHP